MQQKEWKFHHIDEICNKQNCTESWDSTHNHRGKTYETTNTRALKIVAQRVRENVLNN